MIVTGLKMQITIPKKNDDAPYSRKEMEAYLREVMLSKNHMVLRQFALKYYKLHPDFYLGCPINIILHWTLDRMIDEGTKNDTIKVVGEKFGLAPARTTDVYKIKGFDPRGSNAEFMLDYTKLLAQFISRKLAMMPGDNEGVKIEDLTRYIEPDSEGYVPPPAPPGVNVMAQMGMVPPSPISMIPAPQPMPPPAPIRKPRGRPATKVVEQRAEAVQSQTTLSLELLSKSVRAEISSFEEKFMMLQDQLNGIESRLVTLEAKIR